MIPRCSLPIALAFALIGQLAAAETRELKESKAQVAELEEQLRELALVLSHQPKPATAEDLHAMKKYLIAIETGLDPDSLTSLLATNGYQRLKKLIISLSRSTF